MEAQSQWKVRKERAHVSRLLCRLANKKELEVKKYGKKRKHPYCR
jgi:hypothetical protein